MKKIGNTAALVANAVLVCRTKQFLVNDINMNWLFLDWKADETEDGYLSTFIMTAQSDHLNIQSAAPPTPPSNLGVIGTTCNSIQVSWDSPKERGVEVIGAIQFY